MALKILDNAAQQNRAILLITDGMDNAGSSTLNAVLAGEKDRREPIYSIGIGNPNASVSHLDAGAFGVGANDLDRVDANALDQIRGLRRGPRLDHFGGAQ